MKRVLRVRQAQTVVPFGVGAVIDVQGESFVAAGTDRWPRPNPVNEVEAPRLATRLRVARFYAAPPTLNERFDGAKTPGVPYVRFPAWLFCNSCRRMRYWTWRDEQPGKPPTCDRCADGATSKFLTPMRFVQICKDGHLADIDWRWWAHWNEKSGSPVDCGVRPGKLAFRVLEDGFGLEALEISCAVSGCAAKRNLLNILGPAGMRCGGRNPWEDDGVDCEQRTMIVQRTAGNLYYPIVHSALDIPEAEAGAATGLLADRVREHPLWTAACAETETSAIAVLRTMLSAKTGAGEDLIDALLAEERGEVDMGTPKSAVVEGFPDFSREEWNAFTSPQPPKSKDFIVRSVPLGIAEADGKAWQELDRRIGSVILADRLREVRALAGFRRVKPDATAVPVDGTGRSRWLPANEVFGEGIFITLDETMLEEWESQPAVRRRAEDIGGDMAGSFQLPRLTAAAGAKLAPRFVLLHTLAHVLIRTLSFESGYTIASLRERIYGRAEHGQHGLLIYTAAGDAEGTLGGLVRQGEPPRLAEMLLRASESAAWCSADPLCIEHTGQGYERLNRAACHACALLPETSCETGNTLLDRAMLVGGNGIPGYFESFIEAARGAAARALE